MIFPDNLKQEQTRAQIQFNGISVVSPSSLQPLQDRDNDAPVTCIHTYTINSHIIIQGDMLQVPL